MNKTVLALAIFAFCLFPQVLSSGVRGTNDRELGSISLGNLGNIIGSLLGGNKNTTSTTTNTTAPTNSTSSTNTTAPANNSSSSNTTAPTNSTSSTNTTAPVNNSSSSNTTAPANNTSSANTTTPVANNTSANTTAPANNTSSVNTTAPVNNSTSAVNNTNTTSSAPANNTASTNTTQPSDTNNTSSGVNDDNSTSNSSSTNTTTTPAAPTTPVNNNWYARNDVDRAAFKDKCLIIHNILRQAVGVPDLTWSDSLAASAQAWAENMAVNGFRHSGRTGENIASTTYSTKVTVRLLGLWTNEQDWFIKGCTYPKCSSNGNEVGHYTQMVWAKTTQVGCGFAPGVNKQWNYLCCQYYRAGNVIGQTVYPYTAPAV